MLPGIEMMACNDLAVPAEVMQHVVRIESSFNPYAIGVVGGRLVRQPRNLSEAVSTARMLEQQGYNFSLGIAQVNRYNLSSYGLDTYERAFQICPNLQAGSRILAECHGRAKGDWGKALSCYYSGNFTTGFRHGYVQKVLASWQGVSPIPLAGTRVVQSPRASSVVATLDSLVARRIGELAPASRAATTLAAPTAPQQQPQQSRARMAASAAEFRPVPQSSVMRPQPVALQPDGMPPLMPEAGEAAPPVGRVAQEQSEVIAASRQAGGVADAAPARDTAFVF